MAPIVAAIVGSVVRWGITAVSAGAIATAPSTQGQVDVTDDVQLWSAAIAGAISLLWGAYQKTRRAPVSDSTLNP